jgi:hypothetical protein
MKRIRHTYIQIDERIALSRLKKSDIPMLVKHINDPIIFDNTLSLPNPYLDFQIFGSFAIKINWPEALG